MGETMRQGPHQGAQKSSSTGLSDLRTSVSKFDLLMAIAGILLPPYMLVTLSINMNSLFGM
jgi:hypothetical protein